MISAGACARARHRGGDAAGDRDVVVLDHHAAIEPEPVIGAAAAHHGVLLQHAQAGRGLAGVDQPGARAGDFLDVLRGLGGDAGEMLHDVERGALRRSARCGRRRKP